MLVAVEALAALPAEEYVERRMREALPTHHPLAVAGELARAEVGLEHRSDGPLHLQHERSPAVTADEQQHPGAGADAADADDLARHVHEPVAREQIAAVLIEARHVGVERAAHVVDVAPLAGWIDQLAQRHEERRHAAEPELAIDALGQLLDGAQAGLAACLGEPPRGQDPPPLAEPATEVIDELARVEAVIPDVEVALLGERPDPVAVLPHGREHDRATPPRREDETAAR